MEGGEVVFSIKVWCLLLGRTCLELAWQHRSSSFSKDFRKGNGRREMKCTTHSKKAPLSNSTASVNCNSLCCQVAVWTASCTKAAWTSAAWPAAACSPWTGWPFAFMASEAVLLTCVCWRWLPVSVLEPTSHGKLTVCAPDPLDAG